MPRIGSKSVTPVTTKLSTCSLRAQRLQGRNFGEIAAEVFDRNPAQRLERLDGISIAFQMPQFRSGDIGQIVDAKPGDDQPADAGNLAYRWPLACARSARGARLVAAARRRQAATAGGYWDRIGERFPIFQRPHQNGHPARRPGRSIPKAAAEMRMRIFAQNRTTNPVQSRHVHWANCACQTAGVRQGDFAGRGMRIIVGEIFILSQRRVEIAGFNQRIARHNGTRLFRQRSPVNRHRANDRGFDQGRIATPSRPTPVNGTSCVIRIGGSLST